ncbi:MAG: hypothetical protein JST84_10100 [Acidobacteria bacterium]|nr:hypothetical protein [Acidobacteriota bacterium]
MTARFLKSTLALLLFASLALANPPVALSPKDVATQFYRTCLKLKISGLPTAKQSKSLAPYLSQDLQQLIKTARQKQTKFIKDHPDEKPPWIEGDLFSSSFEGSHGFRVGTPVVQEERAEVPIHLFYRDGKKMIRWTDTLVLTRIGNGWVVSDLLYKAMWDFKPGTSLRGVLQSD